MLNNLGESLGSRKFLKLPAKLETISNRYYLTGILLLELYKFQQKKGDKFKFPELDLNGLTSVPIFMISVGFLEISVIPKKRILYRMRELQLIKYSSSIFGTHAL